MSETFSKYRSFIGKELQKQVKRVPLSLSPYFYYHFGWENGKTGRRSSGKLLRPLLCIFSCEANGGDISYALPAACSIELIHNFSLIHDDIEDNSSERHHWPTLWKVFNIPPAINAGDAMFSLAYYELINQSSVKKVSDEYIVGTLKVLSKACLDLCEGQNLDLMFAEKEEIEIEEYLHMIRCKTAALFSASAQIGALLGGASENQTACFKHFGEKLGLAFQVYDDILGIWGDSKKTGKPISDDILGRKKTLPIVFSLKQEKKRGLNALRTMYSSKIIAPEHLPEVIHLLDRYKAREYCLNRLHSLYNKAIESLYKSGISAYRMENLLDLSKMCIGKDDNG